MGFFNPLIPLFSIIRKFLYFISRKIFILLLIIIFLAFFIILSYVSDSKAVYEDRLENDEILAKVVSNVTASSKWPWRRGLCF